MISNILKSSKIIAIGSLLVISTLMVAVMPSFAHAVDDPATAKEAVCKGLGEAFDGEDCVDPEGSSTLDSTISTVIDILSILVAVISVIMIIIAGFRYVTSGGDSTAISGAKNTIIYALVGLLIVALAQVLVRFTVDRATEAPKANVNPVQNPPKQKL
jgi:uncharacterized membrane protein